MLRLRLIPALCAILTMLLAAVSAPAQAVRGHPDWILTDYEFSLVRDVTVRDPRTPTFKRLQVRVTYLNNSTNRIVDSITDNQIFLTGIPAYGDREFQPFFISPFVRNRNVELYPGETFTITYRISLKNALRGMKDTDILRFNGADPNFRGGIRGIKVAHDFAVQQRWVRENGDVEPVSTPESEVAGAP